MRWRNSLAIPIVALLLVVAFSMLLIGYFINHQVFYDALEEREKDKINSIRFTVQSIIDDEAKNLSTLSKIMKTDARLAEGVVHYQRSGGDFRRLKAAMDDLYWQIGAKIFLVTDTDGKVIYRANHPSERGDPHSVWGFEEALAGQDSISSSEGPKGWAIRALAPIRHGGRVVGVLTLGTRIDRAFVEKISKGAGAGVSFATLNGVLASSSPPEEIRLLDAGSIRNSLLESKPLFRMDFRNFKAYQYAPLKIVDETFCLIIETDIGVVRGMLHRNSTKMVRTGALILFSVMLLGSGVTLYLIRPLKKLQRQAQDVVREFTGGELAVDGKGNEIRTLVAANRRMVETIKDHVTEREKTEKALRQSEEQLRQAQKMEAVGRLAGGVAHDFNNLLSVITGYSELLLRKIGEADPARREIGEIHKAGLRATSLTQQLLAFSRRQVLKPKPIQLNDVAAGLGSMLQRLIGEDVKLFTTLGAGLWTVMADPNQIEQVMLNLAVNARDAMPAGGWLSISTSNLRIETARVEEDLSMPAGEYVLLEMSDNGCGMDPETRARIFEPFFTTKDQGKGTGLGLATAYGIVKQSGGFIFVSSTPGIGTAFEIYFPRFEPPAGEPAEAGSPAAESPETKPSRKATVLVVEDEEMVRQLACEALRGERYSILEAPNGSQAISIAERHDGEIDLLLSDMIMPGMNGLELAHRLMPLRPEMKVLFMSGYSEEAIAQFGRLKPGTTFLQKPITPSLLSKRVREILGTPAESPPS